MGWETTDLFHWHRPETNTKWPPNSISQTPSQDPWWKIEHRLHAPGDGLDGLSQDVAADSQSQTQVPQDMGTGCANGIMVKDTNHASGLGQPHHGPRRGTFVDVRWIPVEPQDHLHRPHDFQGHGCWSQLQVLEVNDCQGRAYTLDAAPTSYDARALFCRTGGFGQTSIGISQSHRATVWEAWTNSDKRQGFMDLAGPTRLQRHLCQPQPPGRKHFRRCQRDAGLVAWERANALHNKPARGLASHLGSGPPHHLPTCDRQIGSHFPGSLALCIPRHHATKASRPSNTKSNSPTRANNPGKLANIDGGRTAAATSAPAARRVSIRG